LTIRSAAALVALALAAAPAAAQGTADQRSSCEGDAFRLCSADIPNVSAIEACLQRHEAQLSPACRAEFHPTTKRTKLHRDHFRR
jgi:hypothetical protein